MSERGGGDVSIVTAWSVHALGDVQDPAEVLVLALDQALMDPRYTLLACNALGTSPGLAKGSLCSPHTSHPVSGHHAQLEGTSFGADPCPSPRQQDQPCLGPHCAIQTSSVPLDEASTGRKGRRVPCRNVKSWVSWQQHFLQHPCAACSEAGHSPPSAGQEPCWPLSKGWPRAPQTFPGKTPGLLGVLSMEISIPREPGSAGDGGCSVGSWGWC